MAVSQNTKCHCCHYHARMTEKGFPLHPLITLSGWKQPFCESSVAAVYVSAKHNKYKELFEYVDISCPRCLSLHCPRRLRYLDYIRITPPILSLRSTIFDRYIEISGRANLYPKIYSSPESAVRRRLRVPPQTVEKFSQSDEQGWAKNATWSKNVSHAPAGR